MVAIAATITIAIATATATATTIAIGTTIATAYKLNLLSAVCSLYCNIHYIDLFPMRYFHYIICRRA